MPTIVPAARQLVRQVVAAKNGDVDWKPADEPDGFDRHRAVEFDKATSKWLIPVLEAITDPRIKETSTKGAKGQQVLTVTFVGDVRADTADPFEIEAADEILSGDDEE